MRLKDDFLERLGVAGSPNVFFVAIVDSVVHFCVVDSVRHLSTVDLPALRPLRSHLRVVESLNNLLRLHAEGPDQVNKRSYSHINMEIRAKNSVAN